MSSIAPLSTTSELIARDQQGKLTGTITSYFRQWLLALTDRIGAAAQLLKVVTVPNVLAAGAAAIATTAAWTTTATGLYRLTYVLRVTQQATVSSNLQLTLGWTRAGIALPAVFAAIVNGGPTSVQSGSVLVRADNASDLTYATAYISAGATPMTYELDVAVEAVRA